MTSPHDLPPPPANAHVDFGAAASFGLVELRGSTPLVAQVLPGGALYALRHGTTLINQFLPGPVDNGLFRLLLRGRTAATLERWSPLVAPGLEFHSLGPTAASWRTTALAGLRAETRLQLHLSKPGWRWHIHIENTGSQPVSFDVVHAQDLGLADEGAVRNNEAYTSQYIDLFPYQAGELGWMVFARQNQPMAEGRRPWLAVGCVQGAAEYCTDGTQFFGADFRLAETPAAVRSPALPSVRLQGELAVAGLQSRIISLHPGQSAQVVFIARFVEDHPTASSPPDLALWQEIAGPAAWSDVPAASPANHPPGPTRASPAGVSLFVSAPWMHGETPTASDWLNWFPGVRRHIETASDGTLLSFFQDSDTHVVSRAKEAAIARPHGHILRSGDGRWFDSEHFGLTCYASGIFAAQAYLGHPSFARLLSVVRNPLNVPRASGQRIFLRRGGGTWAQLGVPSAFAMSPGGVRWLYRVGGDVIEVQVSCAQACAASKLDIAVIAGAPAEFMISHELVVGALEFEHAIHAELWSGQGWVELHPSTKSLVGQYQPNVCFAIAAHPQAEIARISDSRLLFGDETARPAPYVVFQSRPTRRCGVLLVGTTAGRALLATAVETTRHAFGADSVPARPLAPPLRLAPSNAAISRINDVLPWFAHNAAIHFSAPHGLEQYGGAAWGVRDVCQGSVEWLLASGEFPVVRRILQVVFAQQYAADGSWPQWFMFPPYRFIQQAHSHGDVCFWPVKALCDYVEASNDLEILQARIGYTDPQKFVGVGPDETLLEHCDRVIAQCEARFVAGTALVNYGDGDWDDTLQPANPAMRTRMISAWTVGLAFHTFRQLAEVCRRAGQRPRAERLDELCARMRRDFASRLMPDGVVAGFLVTNPDGTTRPLLHPKDAITGIRYRLLPMTRSILAELFTPDEARRHLAIIESELRYPDGVRLMNEPSTYQGGVERLFKRGETAANVGREIGLQYVHAHLRYAEALAKVGDAEALWTALQVVNPVDLKAIVPNAADRQSNVYFSSSDADFPDRYVAAKRWNELRTGSVAVRGGWRLYSSGPGLFLHKIRACLLGVREFFDDVVFDPVLPRSLDRLSASVVLCGRPVELRFHVTRGTYSPTAVVVNGIQPTTARREANPYRAGGLLVARTELQGLLGDRDSVIEIHL